MAATLNDVISFRIPHELREKLDKLAQATKQSRAKLLLHWVEDGIRLEEWQIEEIQAGVKEADLGNFASKEDVEKVFNKWL